MKFPFVSRAHHEEVVSLLRSQLAGLASTLYNGDVPEQFQMLLGISVPKITKAPEEEPVLSRDEKLEEEEEARQREVKRDLEYTRRFKPSLLGPKLEQVMKQTTVYRARAANPGVAQMFEAAKKDALKG